MLKPTEKPSELIPAATVLLLRQANDGLETLMLRRNRALKAFGGAWVFPGGRVDENDGPGLSEEQRARAAAIRETREETGLDITQNRLESLSIWIPPAAEIRRFSTWFFVAEAPDYEVQIDEGEIHDFQWVSPAQIIREIPKKDFMVMPPTYISLHALANFNSPKAALDHLAPQDPEFFQTRFQQIDDGFVTCWEGDAAYDDLNFEREGPRRRLTAGAREWRYETDF